MSDDDLIAGLQASVRKEVIERYVRERLILEEETNMVLEAASAWHGGVAAWERAKRRLATALIREEAGRRFFEMAGIGAYGGRALREICFLRPRALWRSAAYKKLIAGLYHDIWEQGRELAGERDRVLELMEEVNRDILHFEANHDMMAISAYLRSLDPKEIQRRKLLGVNFTARETSLSAEALSFRPIAAERLELQRFSVNPRDPNEVMARAGDMLSRICRDHPEEVDRLWS